MPNLAHAICRLSSEIGTGTKAECITSAPLPLHEERRRGRDRGLGGKRPTLNFLSCLPAHSSPSVSGVEGFWTLPSQASRQDEGLIVAIPGQGRRSRPCCCPPGRVRPGRQGAWVLDPNLSLPGLCDLGQPPDTPTPGRAYIWIENSWPFDILVTLLKTDALESCCFLGHRVGVLNVGSL